MLYVLAVATSVLRRLPHNEQVKLSDGLVMQVFAGNIIAVQAQSRWLGPPLTQCSVRQTNTNRTFS